MGEEFGQEEGMVGSIAVVLNLTWEIREICSVYKNKMSYMKTIIVIKTTIPRVGI